MIHPPTGEKKKETVWAFSRACGSAAVFRRRVFKFGFNQSFKVYASVTRRFDVTWKWPLKQPWGLKRQFSITTQWFVACGKLGRKTAGVVQGSMLHVDMNFSDVAIGQWSTWYSLQHWHQGLFFVSFATCRGVLRHGWMWGQRITQRVQV